MSFPHHDLNWVSTARFLEAHVRSGDTVLAPDDFWAIVDDVHRYSHTWEGDPSYTWAVTHKGQLGGLAPSWLASLPGRMRPVYANAVFVVWSESAALPPLSAREDDLRSFHEQAAAACREAAAGPMATQSVLPDPHRLTAFSSMDDAGLAAAMDAFWDRGGYKYETLRDKTYYAEIDRHLRQFLEQNAGSVLDVGCGRGRIVWPLAPATHVYGIELSAQAIRLAETRYAERSDLSFAVGDAHQLPQDDATFDHVLLVDAIEHVRDVERVLDELARVLRPGGRLLLTSANLDSLHLRMTRKLGYPEFRTNWQHIREFRYDELVEMLAERGLITEHAEGLFLYPYWGVPGVDTLVRGPTDHDAEVVEVMRELGERVGPRHAYAFVLTAVRAPQG